VKRSYLDPHRQDYDLATDDEYRARWVDFHMADGTTVDSRRTNWRNVEWEKVVGLSMHIRDIVHAVDCKNKPTFKGFMNFRQVRYDAQYDINGKYTHHKRLYTWIIGWTDGEDCYLKEIDFKMGTIVEEYKQPLRENEAHIHPRIAHACATA
jgi:hypothetical protein